MPGLSGLSPISRPKTPSSEIFQRDSTNERVADLLGPFLSNGTPFQRGGHGGRKFSKFQLSKFFNGNRFHRCPGSCFGHFHGPRPRGRRGGAGVEIFKMLQSEIFQRQMNRKRPRTLSRPFPLAESHRLRPDMILKFFKVHIFDILRRETFVNSLRIIF